MINVSCRIINLGIIKHLRIKKPPSWKSRDLSSSCFVTIRESRSETGWDLGPWNNCINVQLGEILDKKIKKKKDQKNPSATSEEQRAKTVLGAKTMYCTCPLHSTQPWRMGKTPKPPLRLIPWAYPYPHPIISFPPTWGVSQGTSYLFALPPVAAGVLIKPDLNFFSGL